MIARLRRLRWIPLLLTLLSPAVGGEVLPLLHPCPVELPWLAAEQGGGSGLAAAGEHAHHVTPAPADAGDPASHEHGGAGSCSCLGSCHTPGLVAVPRAPVIAVAVEAGMPSAPVWWTIESATVASLDELLPPKTAPPSA